MTNYEAVARDAYVAIWNFFNNKPLPPGGHESISRLPGSLEEEVSEINKVPSDPKAVETLQNILSEYLVYLKLSPKERTPERMEEELNKAITDLIDYQNLDRASLERVCGFCRINYSKRRPPSSPSASTVILYRKPL